MAKSALVVVSCWMCCIQASAAAAPSSSSSSPTVSTQATMFDAKIAPIFVAHCLECHSGAKPKGGLDLSSKQTAMRGESGVVVVPGERERSEMWKLISEGEMPPKKPLKKEEIEALGQWIEKGAIWGTKETISHFSASTGNRAGYDWWSLAPLASAPVPQVKATHRVRQPIDAFVLAKLEASGLSLSADADARTLIRRVYFDLIGLPPSPEEVDAFVRECSETPTNPDAVEQAYTKLIDRLLASPHYGERWGRHWLDVARYGESHGFERNDPRHHAWHFRDWVIRSFNEDMPFDRFAAMQIAGDVMTKDSYDGLAAAGLLVAGLHNTVVGSSPTMKLQARQDELEEIVGMVGQTFLGLTINCARCHDHKFDPITQEEYYRFTASLAGVTHGDRKFQHEPDAPRATALIALLKQFREAIGQIEEPARQAELAARKQGNAPQPEPPKPIARWEFNDDLRDSIGSLHGQASGGAEIKNGRLILDGKAAFISTSPIQQDITQKTLEAWVQLANIDQRGGGVISLQTTNGSTFDAIVLGEREPMKWMAGSDFYKRTAPLGGADESDAKDRLVHIAITYAGDGTITAYRDGKLYGKPYKSAGPVTYQAKQCNIVFGMRHAPAGGTKMLAGAIDRAQLYDRALTAEEVAISAGAELQFVSTPQIIARLTPAQRAEYQRLIAERDKAQASLDELNRRRTEQAIFTVISTKPQVTHLLYRGSVTEIGPVVLPGVTQAVGRVPFDLKLPVVAGHDAGDGERRLALANWVTHKDNALFARVTVNRLWHHHFGTGIVETPSDFGFNAGQPSHPQLLEFLAAKLIDHGYRLKPIHRMIVLSSAYRQQSRAAASDDPARLADANNRLLWRFAPRRLEGEAVRDAMLLVSGQLDARLGGSPFVDVSITPNNGTTYYEPMDREEASLNRRTIYRFSPRGGRSALLDSLDCPDPSATAPRRSVTTTPLQALSLLNNAFVLRMAGHLAQRAQMEAGKEVASQIDRLYALTIQRRPDDVEKQAAIALVQKYGLPTLARALFSSNEFIIAE